jgi:hypothetical protein
MKGMKSPLFDGPRRSSVATDAKACGRRCYDDLGPAWMCADLMNIAVDIDGGPPRRAGVGRPRNPADVDVGHERGAIAGRRHRTNSQRRPHHLAVDDCRSCVPGVAARCGVKAGQGLLRAVGIHAQDVCVVGSDKDNVSDRHAA